MRGGGVNEDQSDDIFSGIAPSDIKMKLGRETFRHYWESHLQIHPSYTPV